jgi:hypothetical protein
LQVRTAVHGDLVAAAGSAADGRVMPEKRVFRISFMSQGQVYEVYARKVSQGELFGFVVIEGLLFGERSQLLVDSSEERLKTEFAGVKRFHVPIHAVLRIDEVERAGAGRISDGEKGSRVAPFPFPVYGPGKKTES